MNGQPFEEYILPRSQTLEDGAALDSTSDLHALGYFSGKGAPWYGTT